MRRAGEVVSKTELLDHVWDAGVDTAPNAVEVYVGYLRRKIGRDAAGDRPRGRLPAGGRRERADVRRHGPVAPAPEPARRGCMLVGVGGARRRPGGRRRRRSSPRSATRCSAPSTPRRLGPPPRSGRGRAGRRDALPDPMPVAGRPGASRCVDAPGPGPRRLGRRRPAGADAAPGRAGRRPSRAALRHPRRPARLRGPVRVVAVPAGPPSDRRRSLVAVPLGRLRQSVQPAADRRCWSPTRCWCRCWPRSPGGCRRGAAPGRGAARGAERDHRRAHRRAAAGAGRRATRSTGWR